MNKLIPVVGLFLFAACSKPVFHTKSASSVVRTYTGDWELLEIHCNGLPVQYSGFMERLRLDQVNREGTFSAFSSDCHVKVSFSISQRGNALTFKSHNIQCLPQSCSITPTFKIINQRIRETYYCPDDLPSEIIVDANLSRENLRIYVPVSHSTWDQCELIYARIYED